MKLLYKILIGVGCVFLLFGCYYVFILIYTGGTSDSPIGNHPPHADISGPQQVYLNELVEYTANGSYDDDGDKLEYRWYFHDGTEFSGVSVQYTYKEYFDDIEKDTHQITLIVSDGEFNNSFFLMVTVLVGEDDKPPEVGLISDSTTIPGLTKYYTINVVSVENGDVGIDNISYTLISSSSGEILLGGPNSTVRSIDKTSTNATIRYMNNWDDNMETQEWFSIDADISGATDGDIFILTHIPTGLKMGECQLIS